MLKKIIICISIMLASATVARADTLFPYFVDIVGDFHDLDRPSALPGFPNRHCNHLAKPAASLKTHADIDRFIKKTIPGHVIESMTTEQRDNATIYTFSDNMPYGVRSFLMIIVGDNGTIDIEYVEAETE